MSELARRLIIALDEWAGIVTSIMLYLAGSTLFWVFTPVWAAVVYGISYPEHWRWLESKGEATPLRFVRRLVGWVGSRGVRS